MIEVQCESCGAAMAVEKTVKSTTCPYCASPKIIETGSGRGQDEPVFVIGFTVDRKAAEARVIRWIRSRGFFVRPEFKKAVPQVTRGVYVPAYIYGARASSSYTADIGENYTVTETYTTTVNGKTVTRTRTRTETEWRPIRGNHAAWIVDVLVTASRGIPNDDLAAIEPFDLKALRRYSPALIAGWTSEFPSLSRAECSAQAHRESLALIGDRLAAFMPGDKHRNLEYSTVLDMESTDLVLLPVWSFAVRYASDEPVVRILLNGQTGRITGDLPLSGARIAMVVVLAIVMIVVVLFATGAFR